MPRSGFAESGRGASAEYRQDVVDLGVISCELLEVGEEDFVSGSDHDGGAQLQRAAARLVLTIAGRERPGGREGGSRFEGGHRAEGAGAHDSGRFPLLVEEHRERHFFVIDERLRIPFSPGSDRGDAGAGFDELVVSLADLTGPLPTGESAEMSQEQQDVRGLLPEVSKAVHGTVGCG